MPDLDFKTPAALDIRDVEFSALVTVLGMLERGEIKHVNPASYSGTAGPKESEPGNFNMSTWCAMTDCGTVMCIGGSAEAVMKQPFDNETDGLEDLFYMVGTAHSFSEVNVEKAASAIRNYLTYGEPRWDEVLAD